MKYIDSKYKKRRIVAWILLTFFISCMTVKSLHTHEHEAYSHNICNDCNNHVVHHGHFQTLDNESGCCTLCKILSLPTLLPTAIVLVIFTTVCIIPLPVCNSHDISCCNTVESLRAPPANIF